MKNVVITFVVSASLTYLAVKTIQGFKYTSLIRKIKKHESEVSENV